MVRRMLPSLGVNRQEMTTGAHAVPPDVITFSALVTAYERGGRWREAEGTFARMRAAGHEPDTIAYRCAFICVCV